MIQKVIFDKRIKNIGNKEAWTQIDELAQNFKLFRLSTNKKAIAALTNLLSIKDPKIGLSYLGEIDKLRGLEIGSENLNVLGALFLTGVKNIDINSPEFHDLIMVQMAGRKMGLNVDCAVGPIQEVYFKKDYDFFVAKDMIRYFNKMDIGKVFSRLIYANTIKQRAKRIYLIDEEDNYEKIRRLVSEGFEILKIRIGNGWHSIVLNLEAIPGRTTLEEPKDRAVFRELV